MRLAYTNEPRGRAYNEAFSKWLAENGFADVDKGTRSRLAEIMVNRPAIEAWRATLASNGRQRINHPSSVWRKWQASDSSSNPYASPVDHLQLENARLQEEIAQMRANGGNDQKPVVASKSDDARAATD
jgi:hypothetical protein